MPERSRFGAVAWYTAQEVDDIVAAAIGKTTDRLLNEELIRTRKEIKNLKEELERY